MKAVILYENIYERCLLAISKKGFLGYWISCFCKEMRGLSVPKNWAN